MQCTWGDYGHLTDSSSRLYDKGRWALVPQRAMSPRVGGVQGPSKVSLLDAQEFSGRPIALRLWYRGPGLELTSFICCDHVPFLPSIVVELAVVLPHSHPPGVPWRVVPV